MRNCQGLELEYTKICSWLEYKKQEDKDLGRRRDLVRLNEIEVLAQLAVLQAQEYEFKSYDQLEKKK